jgi:hypothetical protein
MIPPISVSECRYIIDKLALSQDGLEDIYDARNVQPNNRFNLRRWNIFIIIKLGVDHLLEIARSRQFQCNMHRILAYDCGME